MNFCAAHALLFFLEFAFFSALQCQPVGFRATFNREDVGLCYPPKKGSAPLLSSAVRSATLGRSELF